MNAVGKTGAPSSITVDGQAVPLSAGISSYNVSVSGGFTVLVDAGDIIVHVMQPAVRAYYNLEELWSARPARRTKAAKAA